MFERNGGGNRDNRKPPARGRGGRPAAPGRQAGAGGSRGGASKRGGLGLKRLGGDEFVLVHPKCVREMELDYEEGIELRKAGDPEAARDALRFALQGCGDNLWVHVALGKIALEDFKDPTLARGHFGYAYELVEKAIPRDFAGKLPREHPANRPVYDAIEGLVACYEALGDAPLAQELRGRAALWAKPPGPRRPG